MKNNKNLKFQFNKKISLFQCIFLILLIISGSVIIWITKDDVSSFLFHGKSFSGRNLFFQFSLFFSFLSVFLIISYGLIYGIRVFRKYKFPDHLTANKKLLSLLLFFSIGFVIIFSINNVISTIDTVNWIYDPPSTVWPMQPIGNDFRVGLYTPPKMMLTDIRIYHFNDGQDALSQYPPFLNLLVLPYQLLDVNSAYLMHVFNLFLSNFISLLIAAYLVKEVIITRLDFDQSAIWAVTFSIFFSLLIYSFSSYGFLFSVERGNCDGIALLFSMLSLLVLFKNPNKIWLQVVLLSIAIHIKIYPAALFIIFLIKHGKKIIIPAIIINVVLLFSLGAGNALAFLQIILKSSGGPFIWVGNHSGYSFAQILAVSYPQFYPILFLLRHVFTLIPILIWMGSIYTLLKHNKQDSTLLLLFMVTIPIMDLVPTTSHDYKLVILYPAIIILLSIIVTHLFQTSEIMDYFELFLLMGVLLVIGRSYSLNDSSQIFINNKYLPVIILQILMYFNIEKFIHFNMLPDLPLMEMKAERLSEK